MDIIKKINLNSVLTILSDNISPYPTLFINPSGALETFFTYKGTLIELQKYSISIQLGKETAEKVGEDIRSMLVAGLKNGYWLVFFVGSSPSFNYAEFFKQFEWGKNKDLFNIEKLTDKNFLKSSGILKEEDDVDFNGIKGYYKVNEKSRIVFLCSCEESEVEKVKSNNGSVDFDLVIVE